MLSADDELRHPADDDHFFRESLYFNFTDVEHKIGGWIYLWVLPNQELKSGMLCSFYHGLHPDPQTSVRAQAAPNHIERAEDGRWMYFLTKSVPELLTADFDDVELNGLHLVRKKPLEEYQLDYTDDAGNGFSLTGRFLTLPYDYADHPNPTPDWMAADRYHRAWAVEGTLRMGGEEYKIHTTGDSDHSWGRRHSGQFGQFLFKMWSAQLEPDFAFSVVTMGGPGNEIPYGFISIDGQMRAVTSVEEHGTYEPDGLQKTASLVFTDNAGRTVRATAEMFSSIAAGAPPAYWGHEGGATYVIEGFGTTSGIVSYFWPGGVSPNGLKA